MPSLQDTAIRRVDMYQFDPGYNVRAFNAASDEDDAALKESIRASGVRIPLTIRSKGDSVFVVAGHRRLRHRGGGAGLGDGGGVVSKLSTSTEYCRRPCAECPWRKDQPRRFKPARFRALANTAYDMGARLFACHKSKDDHPVICAGFLLRGATHNLAVRLMLARGTLDPASVTDGGLALHDSYRAMAVANGVGPGDPVLRECR